MSNELIEAMVASFKTEWLTDDEKRSLAQAAYAAISDRVVVKVDLAGVDELVGRLRDYGDGDYVQNHYDRIKAADRIEALEAENRDQHNDILNRIKRELDKADHIAALEAKLAEKDALRKALENIGNLSLNGCIKVNTMHGEWVGTPDAYAREVLGMPWRTEDPDYSNDVTGG